MLAAHQRVSGMNFIPGGHVIPPSIRDARGEVEMVGEASPTQRTGSLSPTAPMQEDLPQEELSPPRERRTKLKHDQWPKKRPRG